MFLIYNLKYQNIIYDSTAILILLNSSTLNKTIEKINTKTAPQTALTPINKVSNPPKIAPDTNERFIVENRMARKADL